VEWLDHQTTCQHNTTYLLQSSPLASAINTINNIHLTASLTAQHTRTHAHTHARTHARTHTHTHTFNGPLSGTTRVSQYQEGNTNLDFTGARDSEWQWAICKSAPHSRQINTPAPHRSVFYRPDALPAAQPTASKH